MIGENIKRLMTLLTILLPLSATAQSDEENVGAVAAARILGSAPLVESQEAQRYLNLVGSVLAARSETGYKWRFGIIKTDSVNAFATPGGFVMVTAGLVKSLENEDEIAYVLAHEIAHVVKKHHYRVVLRQRLAEKAAENIQAAMGESANAALSQVSAEIYARGLDKSSEYEADRLGIELMTQAGFDPAAAVGVLERLQKLKGDDPRAELLFSTHPSPAERLDAVLQSGIEQLPRPQTDSVLSRTTRFKQFLRSL